MASGNTGAASPFGPRTSKPAIPRSSEAVGSTSPTDVAKATPIASAVISAVLPLSESSVAVGSSGCWLRMRRIRGSPAPDWMIAF